MRLPDIGPGNVLLLLGRDPRDSYRLLSDCSKQGLHALCFTAALPTDIRIDEGPGTVRVFLYSSDGGDCMVDPANLSAVRSHVLAATREPGVALVLIDHLEILVGANQLARLEAFLVDLADAAILGNTRLILSGAANALPEGFADSLDRLQKRGFVQIIEDKARMENGLKILLDLSQAISDTLCMEELLPIVAQQSERAFGSVQAALFVPDEEGKALRVRAWSGLAPHRTPSSEPAILLISPGEGPVGRAFTQKGIEVLTHIFSDHEGEPWRTLGEGMRPASLVAVPLVNRGESLGVLCLFFERLFVLDEQSATLMNAIGRQVAGVMVAMRFHEVAAGSNRRLFALLDTSRRINADLSLGRVLDSIASHAAALLGAKKSVVFLWNKDSGALEIAAKKGLKGPEYEGLSIPMGVGVAGKVAQTLKPLIVNDYQDYPFRIGRFRRTTTFMAAPIVKGGELLGVIGVLSEDKGMRFTQDSLDLLTHFALHAAIAVDNARLHQSTLDLTHDLAKRANELSSLLRIGRAASSSLDLDVLMGKAAAEAAAAVGVDRVGIGFLTEERDALILRAVYPADKDARLRFWKGTHLPLSDFTTVAAVMETARPMVIDVDGGGSITEVERGYFAFQDIGSLLIVPLESGGTTVGVISFSTMNRKKVFDEDAVNFCRMIAGEISLAVENARLHAETKENVRRLDSLIGVIKAMDGKGDINAAFLRACREIRRVFGTSGEAVYLLDPQIGSLREAIGRGIAKKNPKLCEEVDCIFLVGDRVSLSHRDGEAERCPASKVGKGGFLCSALRFGPSMYGAIRIHAKNGAGFDSSDRRFLEAVGEQMAGMVERSRLLGQVTQMAVTDPLTGLYNRRELFRQFDEAVGRSERYRRPLSFLMVDLDNFKAYNDALGHQAGDALLREVAGLVRRYIRDADIFCRYGGDELCVILPETGREEACVMAERIRKAVESHCFDGEAEGRAKITLTIGISGFPESGRNRDELIRRADDALYRAKRQGRNRVVFCGEETQ